MDTYALVRFTRDSGEDDEVVASMRILNGLPQSAPIGVEQYWNQLVHELRAADLPIDGACLLRFEKIDEHPRDTRYVMYALVPSLDHEAADFAARLQKQGYDEGMAGRFQVIAMMPVAVVGSISACREDEAPTGSPVAA